MVFGALQDFGLATVVCRRELLAHRGLLPVSVNPDRYSGLGGPTGRMGGTPAPKGGGSEQRN